MNKNKIYFYERPTPDGGKEILDYGEDSAWRVHKAFMQKRDYQYLGWSDGRFMLEARKLIKPTRDANGITEQATEEQRAILLEAIDKEVQFARDNPDKNPPKDYSRKEMGAGISGSIGDIKTPGMLGKMGGGR